MSSRLRRAALLAASLGAPSAAGASASPSAWSSDGAPTVPQGRGEFALFGLGRYGAADGLELAVQPLAFFVLPHAELKWRFHQRGPFSFALRPRLTYPTLFLNLIAKEGTGGLLPENSDVPVALQVEGDAVASWRFREGQLLSAWLGVAFAPRESSDDLPLLDFPFLYPRFAALYTWGVPRAAVSASGAVAGPVFYQVELRGYLLPLDHYELEGAYAFEQVLELDYRVGESVSLELGVRGSVASYPVGTRFHYLPYFDVRFGF